jgi:hypothetical protein
MAVVGFQLPTTTILDLMAPYVVQGAVIMEMASSRRFRFQYSLRALLIVTAIAALLLVPVAWVGRERQRVLAAREAALRAVVLAERDRALSVETRYYAAIRAQTSSVPSPTTESRGPFRTDAPEEIARKDAAAKDAGAPVVEQLMRENAAMKKTIEQLHREIGRLKAGKTKG